MPNSQFPNSNISIALDSEAETRLRNLAARQGQDISIVAAELLARALAWEEQDSQEAIQGIQRGLDDFEAGRFRSFSEFAEAAREDIADRERLVLSDRERDLFLSLIENPPEPCAALRAAMKEFQEEYEDD